MSTPHQISTLLNGYQIDRGQRPFFFNREQTEEESRTYGARMSAGSTAIGVMIQDGRGQNLSLDRNAFELIPHETTLRKEDFYADDEELIKLFYYKEIAEVMQQVTGATFVHVFHHQVRNSAVQVVNPRVKGYAAGIHSDSHPQQADTFFQAFLARAESISGFDLSKGRYLYLNAWRNISNHPVQREPLAVCDETSLCKPDDYISCDVFRPGSVGSVQQYRLNARHASQHRWYYFPRMTNSEVLLFKQQDSDPTLSGRCCFHTSFTDPTAPNDAPPRESVEVRAMCFFPNHTPNTCPSVYRFGAAEGSSDLTPDGEIGTIARKVTGSLKRISFWPAPAKQYVLWLGSLPAGPSQLARSLVKDKENRWGLRSANEAKRDAVYVRMMRSREQGGEGFDEEFKAAVATLQVQGVVLGGNPGHWAGSTGF